jgi:hypothetical protein
MPKYLPKDLVNKAARLMTDTIRSNGELPQEDAAMMLAEQLGFDCVYENENSNLAIHRDILAAFKTLTAADVVWDRRYRLWRKREEYDDPARRQSE